MASAAAPKDKTSPLAAARSERNSIRRDAGYRLLSEAIKAA